jgi:hypothetical protein
MVRLSAEVSFYVNLQVIWEFKNKTILNQKLIARY